MQYYAKLGCLLIDHGTDGIRNYFHNHILRGQTPQQFFTTNKTHIDNLHHGRHGCKRLINKKQYDLINNQPPDLKGFDITLIFLLIRQFQIRIFFLENILRGQSFSGYIQSVQSRLPSSLCKLIPKGGTLPQFDSASSDNLYELIQNLHPFTTPVFKPNAPVWDDPAKAAGALQDMQDIILLKFERNSLAHRESTDITPSEFEQKWTTISSAIIRLGVMTPAKIQQLKHQPIEPEREMSYQICILRGYLEEIEMLRLMQNMDGKLDHIYAKLDDLCKRQDTSSSHCEVQQNLAVQQTNLHVEHHHHYVPPEERPEKKPEQDILTEEQLTLLQNHLAERYSREMSCVPRIPWDDTDTMNIDDVFVDLSLIQEQKKGGALESYQDIFKPDIRRKRIIIRGKAGCGKSTVAAKMTVDWAKYKNQCVKSDSSCENSGKKENCYLEDVSLLFLIRLRFLDKDQTLLESIKDQLIDPSLEISGEALLKYMHSNAERILIILDGYDEYYYPNPQNDISKLIKGETLANVTVVVTSRPWKAHELSKNRPSDTHVEINDMSPEKILEFIQSHFKDEDSNFHKSVVQYVEKFHLSQSPTPLLLLFICILWDEETAEKMPNSITVLYQELVTLLSDRYVARQENQETAERYLSEKTNIIGMIAFHGILSGNLTFDESNSNIRDLGEEIFHTGIMSRLKLSSIRRKIHISSFSFIHKTLQEYFAAKYIVDSWKEESQSEPIKNFLSHVNCWARFQDMANVIQFVCGLSSEVAAVIFSHLHSLAYKDEDFYHSYFEFTLFDQNCLFIRLITEMLTNNRVVGREHMQWLNHLCSYEILGIYPPTADCILQYAHQVTWCVFTGKVDARVHKLQYHTIFHSLKRLHIETKDNGKNCRDNQCAHPNSTFLSGSPMDYLEELVLTGDTLGLFLTLKRPFPSLKVLGICSCSPPGKLVDLFQLLSTKSMVNLLILYLSNMDMAVCETCQRVGDEVKSERAREYKRDPLIVTIPPYHDNACLAIMKRHEFDISVPSGEHTILIDTLCDLALQLKHLPNLEQLALRETKITPVGLKSLTDNLHHVPRLQALDISNNFAHMGLISNIDIPTVITDLFRKLQPMNMTYLDISSCNIGLLDDMAPAMKALSDNLKQWKELRYLNISNNSIGDAIAHLVDSLNRTNLPRLKNVVIARLNMLSATVQNNYDGKLNAMQGLTHASPFDLFVGMPDK